MKILIFIENDLIVRHFIFSRAFEKINKEHEVVYVFPFGDKRMGDINPLKLDLNQSNVISLSPNPKRLKLWRLRFFVEKLRYRKEVSKKTLKRWHKDFKMGNPKYALYLYLLFGLPIVFRIFTVVVNFLISQNPNKSLINILSEEKPDLLIHPSVLQGSYIDDVVFYGNKIKKPVVIIMNSWDNPTTKRSVVNKNYFLLVWGQQTKKHALQYMGLKDNNVIKFGSAQFDIYNSENSENWKSQRKLYGFDEITKTLLYAGSSKYSDEFLHMKIIDDAIAKGDLPKINVIYRPHPWGGCGYKGYRFKEYKFKNVKFDLNMREYIFRDFNKVKTKFLPSLKSTKDLIQSVDFVISPLSTILLEAMMLGKIPICLMTHDELYAKQFQMTKDLPYFEDMLSNEEVLVLDGANFLIDGIKDALKKSSLIDRSSYLKKQSEYFISKFSTPFNERLLELVDNLHSENKLIDY